MSSKKQIEQELKRFGLNLKRERTSRKVTQETLAERANLNVRTIQKIEAGKTNILITTAKRLKSGLGCSWESLMG